MQWEMFDRADFMPFMAGQKTCTCTCQCGACNCAMFPVVAGRSARQAGYAAGHAGHDNIANPHEIR